jgi:ribonuclease R
MAKSPKRGAGKAPFPSRTQLLEFIRESDSDPSRREIARAFRLKGEDRARLRAELKAMEEEGLLDRPTGKRYAGAGELPAVTVLIITGLDPEGELRAEPADPRFRSDGLKIYVAPYGSRGAPAAGDRVLARLSQEPDGSYLAKVMRPLESAGARRLLCVLREAGRRFRADPLDARQKRAYDVYPDEAEGAKDGDIVWIELHTRESGLGPRHGRVIERVGRLDDPRTISLIAAHDHDIPMEFPAAAIEQAEAAGAVPEAHRSDLRDISLVTIDGADARDFDDAVWAEADEDPRNPGGWHLLVAIADVAHYVRPGDPLDREAQKRGNSVYFPDRVIPMLPEALSNGWCSLKPDEDRGCLAVHMWIDAEGNKRGHKFVRGIMRSAARLTYTQAQTALDGTPDETAGPVLEPVLRPLHGAYKALAQARAGRGALEIELPEPKIEIGEDGHVGSVVFRDRLDTHKLIEEFMILANVCAAETLEAKKAACMYRVHDTPDKAGLLALSEFLKTLDIRLPLDGTPRPGAFNNVIRRAAGTPWYRLVMEITLRAQAQAIYSPENHGHFGLALARYAHFTSPIRRYADLLVHRSLIRALGFGEGGLSDEERARFAEIGEYISGTERRAAAAERDANDRYIANYLAERIGAEFTGRVTGVTRFGLFVALEETGADGLVPIRTLGRERFIHDEKHHCLVGEQSGELYSLGDRVKVELSEADTVTAQLTFKLVEVIAAAQPDVGVREAKRRAHRGAGRGRDGRRRGNPRKGARKRR